MVGFVVGVGAWVGLGPQVDLAVLVPDPCMVEGVEVALAVLDDLVRVRVRVRVGL